MAMSYMPMQYVCLSHQRCRQRFNDAIPALASSLAETTKADNFLGTGTVWGSCSSQGSELRRSSIRLPWSHTCMA